METIVSKAAVRGELVLSEARQHELSLRAGVVDSFSSMGFQGSILSDTYGSITASRQRYSLFRGWLYAAINALASEAAGQPVNVGRLLGSDKPAKTKSYSQWKKAARTEWEVLEDHPLLDVLEHPNLMQGRWEFVYSFVANLNLTGWGYVVGGENEETGQMELYSLPTTWIRPDHEEGPFTKFYIVNPRKGEVEDRDHPLTRDQVAFAHLPNPADPLSALAPAQSQMAAIRIDDHIQTSQEQFFNNGIFPSVIVTIGTDPHPSMPGAAGIRPRLTAGQRRQVTGAIQKVMGGVANYGNPAIIDGLIEKIEKLSYASEEMGWEKSEGTIQDRILSAFCVHPYILGKAVAIGGYAQVANIEARFYKRVNTFLDMLGNVITNFAGAGFDEPRLKPGQQKKKDKIFVWWDKCEPNDPQLRSSNLNAGRNRGDISRNEWRAEHGFPPDEPSGSTSSADKGKLIDTAADVSAISAIQAQVAKGEVTSDQAAALLEIAFGLPLSDSIRLAGGKLDSAASVQQQGGKPTVPVLSPEEQLEQAVALLVDAGKRLTMLDILPVEENTGRILREVAVVSKGVEIKFDGSKFKE